MMSFLAHKKQILKAFTLIEMLIVVVIIGILATALIPRLQQVNARARDATRKKDIADLTIGLNLYYIDSGAYPYYVPDIYPGFAYGGNNPGLTIESSLSNSFLSALSPKYLTIIPKDPVNTVSMGCHFLRGAPCTWSSTNVDKSALFYIYLYYTPPHGGDLATCDEATGKPAVVVGAAHLETVTTNFNVLPLCVQVFKFSEHGALMVNGKELYKRLN